MKTRFLFILLLVTNSVFAKIKVIEDRAIEAQHKRMVFEKWGDFYPYPKHKKILWVKIQTNFAASTVWGYRLYGIPFNNSTTRRNRRYKEGKDIRPLKPTGLQNQRFSERVVEKKETDKIKEETTDLKNKSKRDFAHWTSVTASADPLWLLYYKRMLNALKVFPEKPKDYKEWILPNDRIYQKLLAVGTIEQFQEQLDLLKHNYKVSRTVDMPRGKRILLYHKILIAWRKFEMMLQSYSNETKYFLAVKNRLNKSKETSALVHKADVEIAKEVMKKYKSKI